MSLDWIITLTAMTIGVCLMALAIWQSGRKRPDSVKVRWISWRVVIVIVGGLMSLGYIHILSLLGFHTGRNG